MRGLNPWSHWRTAIAGCLLVLCAVTSLRAEEVRLSLPEARSTAARLLAAGDPKTALIVAQGILLGAPDDTTALMLKSRALRDLGRNDEAQEVARAAWSLADGTRDRFFSAMVVAQASASNGQRGYAQYWLRRAAQLAPDDRLKAMAVKDFRHVRSTTPWRLDIRMSVAPSDNLNGAPKTNTFTFAGLPFVNPAAVPLSGIRYGFDADYVYRVQLGPHQRLNFGASVSLDRVRFSDDARRKVPTIENKDYRQDTLTISMGYETRAADARWLFGSKLSFSRNWHDAQPLSDVTRLDLSHGRVLGANLEMGVRLAFEDEKRHDLSKRDSQTTTLGFNLTHRLAHGALRLDLMAADTVSDSRSVARDTRRAVLSYVHSKPIKGLLPRIALSYETVHYDQAPAAFWTVPREDEEVSLSVDVLMPKLDYYGFAPEIGVSFRDRQSNYSLYETESTDLRLGIRSVF